MKRLSYFRPIVLSMLMLASTIHADSVRLQGSVPVDAELSASFFDRLNSDENMNLSFVLPLRNQAELETLIQRLYDPADPSYGQYLAPEEFYERYAPTENDYNKVVQYAKSQGFTINELHSNRLLVSVQATAQKVEDVFHVCMGLYEKGNGRLFFAPDVDPQVPSDVADLLTTVVGLDNSIKRKPHLRLPKDVSDLSERVNNSFPSGPNSGFAPNDLKIAYNLSGVPANGTGQNIALLELASYQASDINTYTNQFGLPTAKLKNVLVDGGSGAGIDAEVTLDIELALALAPESTIYVYEGPNSDQGILDTYNRIATDNIAKQISTSWGLGEDLTTAQFRQAENAIFMQMAAQGQSIYAAAGDSGAYDDYSNNQSKKLMVDDPASQPYVTGVGGTSLKVNPQTGAYASESVWDNGLGNGAGGGGVSTVWTIPTWQKSVSGLYSTTERNVPDVALNADPDTGYAIYYDGSWQIFGGTSCAAPLWAAFNALVNQQLVAEGQPTLGYVNPVLYNLCTTSAYSADLHDVTSGNNLFYQAHTGYDNATGWGSFNGGNLYAALTKSTTTKNLALLNVALTHTVPFVKGSTGNYYIVVTNNGKAATNGAVTLKLNLPEGLTFSSFVGSGWTFNESTLTFTRSDVLSPGAHYTSIHLIVKVSKTCPSTVIPSVTISGGGSVSSTVTNLTTTH